MSAWYRSGTIAVAGKTVTGTGTNWTDNKLGIGPGQALLIPGAGTVKVYEIARVNSATQLTLMDDAGTVAAGQAYAIMSFYSDSVPDFARRLSAQLSYYQSQMDGWQEIMTGTDSITLEAPDGSQVTLSSFKKLTSDMAAKADKVDGAVPVTQGGTGATTKEDARTNLGLGSSATKNTGTTSNDVMQPGMFGLGRPDGVTRLASTSIDGILAGFSSFGFSILRNDAQIPEPWYVHNYSPAMWMRAGDTYTLWCAPFENSGFIRVFGGADGRGWLTGRRIWDDVTTSVDVNGFIKKASPVIKLRGDGTCEVNDEADGCTVIRQGTGVYLIDGCMGLHSDAAWGGPDGGFEIPVDRNKLAPIWLDYTVNADGSILVKTYHRTHPDAPEFARNLIGEKDSDGNIIETVKNGEPIDIPAGLFVSVRVEMPENSIFNQKLKETEDAVLAAKQENDDNNEPNQ